MRLSGVFKRKETLQTLQYAVAHKQRKFYVVKDEGYYIMNDSFRYGDKPQKGFIVYALGYEKGCEHIGGDDIGERFDAASVLNLLMNNPHKDLHIVVTENEVKIEVA
jgi:hypothetical protein